MQHAFPSDENPYGPYTKGIGTGDRVRPDAGNTELPPLPDTEEVNREREEKEREREEQEHKQEEQERGERG